MNRFDLDPKIVFRHFLYHYFLRILFFQKIIYASANNELTMKCRCECTGRNCLLYLDRVLPVITGGLLVVMGLLSFVVIHAAHLQLLYPYAVFVLFQVIANWYQITAYSNFKKVARHYGIEHPNAPYYCDDCRMNQLMEVHHCWVSTKSFLHTEPECRVTIYFFA